MRRLVVILLVLVLLPGFFLTAEGQARITTRKYKLADFPSKTTRVVLTGNQLSDELLKEEVSRRWRISPYEFCSVDEFEASRTSTLYYFLVPMQERYKDGTEGITYLTVIKGGKKVTANPDEKSIEVVSLPYASNSQYAGREAVFLPALLDVLQKYIMDALTSPDAAMTGLARYNLSGFRNKSVILSVDDVTPMVAFGGAKSSRNVSIVSEEEANEAFQDGRKNTLVSYVVAPASPRLGAWCYKMLITADTHELCFYRRHRLTGPYGVGFLKKDFKWFSR